MAKDLKLGTGVRGHFVWCPKTRKMKRAKKQQKKQVHGVIQDTMEPIESMATPHREKFDSRSKYRKHLKAHGFEDVGKVQVNLPSASDLREREEKEDRERREDIERAHMDIKYDRVQFSEREKQNHIEEERRCRANNLPTKLKNPY